MLVPLITVAVLACAAVAWSSWSQGRRRAIQEVLERYQSIRATVQTANYPLTQSVLHSLAGLTGTQWLTLNADGQLLASTLDEPPVDQLQPYLTNWHPVGPLAESAPSMESSLRVNVGGKSRVAFWFHRQPSATVMDQASLVVVLFDQEEIDAASHRAAMLPLVTGLSTVAAVSLLMFVLSSRLINRIRTLQNQVQQISQGDFESRLRTGDQDELGRLASSINQMAGQLQQLWLQVNRQQSAKLLHQIAGGMAHQLRNTLTGARMAMELHLDGCHGESTDEVRMAIRQLEIAEDYVNRLLTIGQGVQHADRPQGVRECLEDIRSTHASIAMHLRVHVDWDLASIDGDSQVRDGVLFSAAISNLVLNAMQAGDRVGVSATMVDNGTCRVQVRDNGGGIDPSVQQDLFEPFVTSKPEGMGLGLPLVKRAAGHLGGDVSWHREGNQTVFVFVCATMKEEAPCPN